MWLAVIAAVGASSGNNIGKVLQKQATRSLPRLTLESKVLLTYLLSPLWVTGLIIDVGGGLLMLQAVASAPVSIVQPVSTAGLALMALFSHIYLHEPMRLADWTGILLCILGTVAVGVSSENPLPSAPPPQLSLRHLFGFVFWVVLFLAVLEWCATSSKAKRKIKDAPISSPVGADVVEELAAGTQAGAFFGLSAAAVKTGMLLATGGPPVFALLGIAVGISLSSFGFFCQTRGFKEGRAVVVSTCAAVAAMLTAVAAGMAGLGEDLPSNPRLRMWRFLGWSLILFGIMLLVAAKPPDLIGLAKADMARRKPLHPSPRATSRSTASPSGLSIGITAGFPRKYEP